MTHDAKRESERIEAKLLAALKAAREELNQAKERDARAHQLSDISTDLPSGHPDGTAALRQASAAAAAYCDAVRKYTSALRDFSDFLIRGKTPENSEKL